MGDEDLSRRDQLLLVSALLLPKMIRDHDLDDLEEMNYKVDVALKYAHTLLCELDMRVEELKELES